MAFSNISSLDLGNLLQIVFSDGVRNQISQDFRDWEMIKRAKVGNSLARELRFMFQNTLGPAAVQWRNPGTSNRTFPNAQQSGIQEYTAKFKEINATIELEYNLWSRAQQSPEKYAEPLALEISSKASAAKRRIAADLYGDGSGVVGTLGTAAVSVTSPASDQLVFQLATLNASRGHVGFFEFGDILILRTNAGATTALDTSLATEPLYWKVIDKNFDNQTVTLQGLNSSYASAGTISSITTQPASGAVFYRYDQPTIPDLSSSIADYGTLTEVMAGLESLVAGDGRVVHGITMSGSTSGGRVDCGANPIDVKFIQKVMSKVKRNVGQDRYNWKMMIMSPETLDSFIESRETDRRFNTMEDAARGTKKFMYQHQNDSLECYTTEYVPQKRVYIIPETKASEKVLEFHGTDFETVKIKNGDEFRLKATSSGYVNNVQSFLQAVAVLICKQPSAVAVLENFTNS